MWKFPSLRWAVAALSLNFSWLTGGLGQVYRLHFLISRFCHLSIMAGLRFLLAVAFGLLGTAAASVNLTQANIDSSCNVSIASLRTA